jgi:hypothetical protein
LAFEFKIPLDPTDEESDEYGDCYVRYMESDITLVKWNEKTETHGRDRIGHVVVWYLDGTRAIDNRLDIVDICDAVAQEQYDYARSIYINGFIDPKICEVPRSNDVLILHLIEIDPKYRGHKYGLVTSQKICDYLGYNCGAILLRPLPLQFSPISQQEGWQERYNTSVFPSSRKESTKRLSAYWKKLGLHATNDKTILCIPQE